MHSVQVCQDCYSNPQNINEDNVNRYLQAHNWPQENIAQAMSAIKALKKKSG
jgi:hypothetical protein